MVDIWARRPGAHLTADWWDHGDRADRHRPPQLTYAVKHCVKAFDHVRAETLGDGRDAWNHQCSEQDLSADTRVPQLKAVLGHVSG